MRFWIAMTTLPLAAVVLSGCIKSPEKLGLACSGSTRADNVRFLVDETWVDEDGIRHTDQEIYDSVFEMIDEARQFVLLDFFLMNDFGYVPGPCMRPLSQELADRLVAKRKLNPEVEIIFITDPINTVYGSVASPHFQALEAAGVQLVWTDLDKMRDSNPIYSKPWRLLVKPFGVGPGKTFSNPMGAGRISIRSMLKLFNFKANHRKIVINEKSLLVTSANPHSASSAHWNVALRVDGAGVAMACESESAILGFSGAEEVGTDRRAVRSASQLRSVGALGEQALSDNVGVEHAEGRLGDPSLPNDANLELLTEIRIKEKVLALLEGASPGARIDLCMFYLSEKDVVKAFIEAGSRGCNIRVILDPAEEAFGREKNGVPNRQSAARLAKADIPLRWAETHGEQCHAKMLYVEHADQSATLLLGSCNYTRRNMNNFNAECDLAFTASVDEASMQRVREVFDRWWNNSGGRIYTTEYAAYEDPSRWRTFSAWWKETTGMGTF